MANGKVCPAYGTDIGVWAIVAAGLPNRIRCPHCRALFRYDGTFALMVLPFAIVTWVPVEFLLALYLRDHRNLHLVKPRPGSPTGA